jgi:hypothetical protein
MPKSIEQMISEQIGGLTLELIKRDIQIDQLTEENAKLKAAIKMFDENSKPAKEVEKK